MLVLLKTNEMCQQCWLKLQPEKIIMDKDLKQNLLSKRLYDFFWIFLFGEHFNSYTLQWY